MNSVAVIDSCTIINFKNLKRFDIFEKLNYFLCTTIYIQIEMRKGKEDTFKFYKKLEEQNKIKHVPLSIEDLMEMANVPESRHISDAELSCLVKAKEFNCKAFSDDKRAIKYAQKFTILPNILGTKDILISAYLKDVISDGELQDFQEILKKNKFMIKGSLLYEASEAKMLMYQSMA